MWWTFEGNTSVSGAAGGFIIRGQHITVKDNRVFDTPGFAIKAATFDGVTEQRGITVSGNRVVRAGFGMSVDGQAAGGEPNSLKYNVQINGNYLLDAGPNPILLRHFDGAEVHGNTVVGSSAGGTSHAIYILGISGTQSTSLTMVGNHVRDSGASAIRVTLVDDVSITGGVCAAPGANGIDLTTCNRTSVSGVEIRTPGQNGILLSGGSVHNLSGATVSGGAGSTFDALRVTGTSDVTVAGGYYASARWAIFSTTTDYVSITGVNARAAFNAGRISVDATNKSVVNNLV